MGVHLIKKQNLSSSFPGEEWRPVIGFERSYMVSNIGRVKGLRRLVKCQQSYTGLRMVKGKIKSQRITQYGYVHVFIQGILDGVKFRQNISVHRLVAKAFIPNPENKPTVNHKNGDKTDNNVENLEWATHSEQQIHSRLNDLSPSIGQTHHKSKLSDVQVLEIINSTLSNQKLSSIYNVNHRTISVIKTGKAWKHLQTSPPKNSFKKKKIYFNGKEMWIKEIASSIGIDKGTLSKHLKRGVAIENIVLAKEVCNKKGIQFFIYN